MTEKMLDRLYQELFDKIAEITLADLKDTFSEDSILLRVINQSGWSDLGNYYQKYTEKLGISSSVLQSYQALSSSACANVDKEVAQGSESEYYTDLKQIGVSLKTAVEKYQENNVGGGRGGNGGGSSSSSGSVRLPVPPVSSAEQGRTEPQIPFGDLENVEWAKESITALYNKGIINGVGNGLFAPEDLVAREEFVKMLICALEITGEKGESHFEDIDEGAWYEEYIRLAVGAEIISGVSETRFGIGEQITREQMAVMIGRAIEYLGIELQTETEVRYTDEISDYARDEVERISKAGIMNGVGEGKFDAFSGATRAQAAKVIYEVMQKIK